MNNLTVVICAYNVGTGSRKDGTDFIRRCLSTIRADIPIVIVDDGSTDDTLEIINRNRRDNMQIVTIPENGGLRNAYNIAIEHVETSYFVRVDADILFPREADWDTQLVKHFTLHPECGAAGAVQYLPDGRLWCAGDRLLPKYEHIATSVPRGGYRICHSVMGCFSAYPMHVWREVGGVICDQWMRGETEDLNLRVQKAGYEVHCLPLHFVHCHADSRCKSGEYNNPELVASRIRAHFLQHYGFPFYEESNAELPYLKPIQTVSG